MPSYSLDEPACESWRRPSCLSAGRRRVPTESEETSAMGERQGDCAAETSSRRRSRDGGPQWRRYRMRGAKRGLDRRRRRGQRRAHPASDGRAVLQGELTASRVLVDPDVGARLVVEGVVLTTAWPPFRGPLSTSGSRRPRAVRQCRLSAAGPSAYRRRRPLRLRDHHARALSGRTRHIHVTVAAPNRPPRSPPSSTSARGRQSAGRDLRVRAADEAPRRPRGQARHVRFRPDVRPGDGVTRILARPRSRRCARPVLGR